MLRLFYYYTSAHAPTSSAGIALPDGTLDLQYGHGKPLFYTTPFTITEEQLVEVSSNNNSLSQPPATDSLLSRLSPLQFIGGAVAVLLHV